MKLLNMFLNASVTSSEAIEKAEETVASLGFDPMKFVDNLKYMGIGMLVIFVIIGVIIISTLIINKCCSVKKK